MDADFRLPPERPAIAYRIPGDKHHARSHGHPAHTEETCSGGPSLQAQAQLVCNWQRSGLPNSFWQQPKSGWSASGLGFTSGNCVLPPNYWPWAAGCLVSGSIRIG